MSDEENLEEIPEGQQKAMSQGWVPQTIGPEKKKSG
jgi:hypothetical protein